jgi:hypothetical protein
MDQFIKRESFDGEYVKVSGLYNCHQNRNLSPLLGGFDHAFEIKNLEAIRIDNEPPELRGKRLPITAEEVAAAKNAMKEFVDRLKHGSLAEIISLMDVDKTGPYTLTDEEMARLQWTLLDSQTSALHILGGYGCACTVEKVESQYGLGNSYYVCFSDEPCRVEKGIDFESYSPLKKTEPYCIRLNIQNGKILVDSAQFLAK